MSKKIDDCVDALCHALGEINTIDDRLRCAALTVLSAYHSAPDEKRPEFEESLISLGETVDTFFCLKGSVEGLHKRIA